MRCFVIGALELVAFFLATINFRACAKGFVKATVLTDVLISANGFLLTKMIVEAKTPGEMGSYVLGAALGSIIGMRITRSWDHDK
jgi:hypothetical protein